MSASAYYFATAESGQARVGSPRVAACSRGQSGWPRIQALLALLTLQVGLALLCAPRLAAAHAQNPALLELRERPDGIYELRFQEGGIQGGGPELAGRLPLLPQHCRDVSPPLRRERREANERALSRTLDCGPRGLRGAVLSVRGFSLQGDEVLCRVTLRDGTDLTAVLRADAPALRIPASAQDEARGAQRPAPPSWVGFLRLGVRHILTGFDHLLFVTALVLLHLGCAGPPAARLARRLLLSLTAFTLAHSITLSLATLGLLRLPPAPVEASIALSILFLAAELCGGRGAGRHPAPIAFAFGLLHGLGFAGVLTELGLPRAAVVRGLLGFNLGVELGQVLFVTALALLRATARRLLPRVMRAQGQPAARRALAYGIGALAAFWFWHRVAALAVFSSALPER